MNEESRPSPFQISYNEAKGYVHVTATGNVNLAAVRAYDEAIQAVLEEHGATRILIDARNAAALLSSSDVFNMAHTYESGPISTCRRALVHPPGVSGPVMYETVVRSLGQDLRTFTDIDEALAWLLEGDEPPPDDAPESA